MVGRIIRALSKEINGLHEAAYLLALFAFLSQILALVRDRLLTYYFGASSELDIYYAAFKIPDIIYVLVASMVSVSVLVPFLSEKIEKQPEKKSEYINSLFSFFFLSILVVSLIAFLAMPFLVKMLFSGIPQEKITTLIWLSRLLLIQPVLLGATNFFGSVSQIYKQFGLFASGPVLYNSGIILGLIFLYPYLGLYGLGFGVILGVIIHVIIQIPFVASKKCLPTFFSRFNFSLIKETVKLSLPRTFSLGAGSAALLLIIALASKISEGSISIFTLSSNLQGVPLAIVGVSYSLAAFPALVKYFIQGRNDLFLYEVSTSFKHIIFWSLPITVLFIVLRAQIVRVILGASTRFGWDDTRLTAAVLAILSLAVLFQGISLLLTRSFYAARNTITPLVINSMGAGLMFALSFFILKIFRTVPEIKMFLTSLFKIENIYGNDVLALGIGVALASIISSLCLWFYFERDFKGLTISVSRTFMDSFVSATGIGLVSYFFLNIFDKIFSLKTLFGVFMQGFLSGIIGIIVGIIILKILKNKELDDIWKTLHKKIWKAKVIVAES